MSLLKGGKTVCRPITKSEPHKWGPHDLAIDGVGFGVGLVRGHDLGPDTVLYRIALYRIVLYRTVLYCTVRRAFWFGGSGRLLSLRRAACLSRLPGRRPVGACG